MPYCQNCGRPLGENEVCVCTPRNTNPNPAYNYQNAPNQNPNVQNPNPAYNYQNAPNQNPNVQNQKPKKKSGIVILIIILIIVLLLPFVLAVLGIFAAILVPSMIGFVTKSKQTSVNSITKTIHDTYSTALIELDSHGYDLGSRPYIIGSDPDMNVYVPFDVNECYKIVDNYFNVTDNYDYFVVISNGEVIYAACEDNDDDYIGTYPKATGTNSGPVTVTGSIGNEDWDLWDLYEDTYDILYDYYW